MPLDDGGKGIDDQEFGDAVMHQRCDGGVAQTEPADDDLQ